ncbi:class I SAM-dependent methyltransferase [Lysobacter sp. CA196]|uniref:class I SAM-dependent methyltransferase n=1 Tax=Lysobacter sp. CA196 TaxID=3455606 RepID=UPI003F8D7356
MNDYSVLRRLSRRFSAFREPQNGPSLADGGDSTPLPDEFVVAEPAPKILVSEGLCPTCGESVVFSATHEWLRDSYLCESCGSIPRERALMYVIDTLYPQWREMRIHESSPAGRGASLKLQTECRDYIPTQFFPGVVAGEFVSGVRCENMEKLSFADESIDLHISQDVMEHVFDPAGAFYEVARTLRPGGAHIFTVPLVHRNYPSERRASLNGDGSIEYLREAQYHGNPVSEDGALVTVDWGYDICRYIHAASGLFTQLIRIDDLSKGIRAELNEVLVTVKPGPGQSDRI